MNRALAQAVVESLRVAGENEKPLLRLATFTRRDWQQTLPWLDDSGLALCLLERVKREESRGALPAEIQARLQRDLVNNRRRVTKMKQEFDSLNRRFETAGVEYAVLKGFALIPDYCPDAALRSQYDYDYLVHPESLDNAQQALLAAGYSQRIGNTEFVQKGESLFSIQPLSYPSSDEDFYSAEFPRAVELHLKLWHYDRARINLEEPSDILGRKYLTNLEGLRFPVLADEDALIGQALHAFQHILDYWCRPSCFLEIAYFLARRHSDAAFWERFRSRVECHRCLDQIVGLVFSMAESLFQAPIPAEVSAWTTENLPATLSRWVELYGKKWAIARFPGSKLSLLLHREFIEDPQVWREIWTSRLFPFHRPVKVVEATSPTMMSHGRATWDQGRFALSRLSFHLNGLVSYTWELPRWKRNLRLRSANR